VIQGKTKSFISYAIQKEGYYSCPLDKYWVYKASTPCVKDGRWIPWNPMIEITLKEKRTPVPMYVKQAEIGLPRQGEPFGFDFKVGDLVAPHGKGEQADLLFSCTVERRNETFGDFKKELFILAVQPEEGIIVNAIDKGSTFSTNYEASENGYQSQYYSVLDRTPSEILQQIELSQEEYLTFRSRIIRDDNGQIISSNYGKITGKLGYYRDEKNPDGAVIKLLYYFNPVSNDRNILFDTEQNLFGTRERGYPP